MKLKKGTQKEKQNNYQCVICLEWCKKPISCIRCKQLMCHMHVKLIMNKCPHCRLEPFQFRAQEMIESYIEIEVRKKREQMKKNVVFKCLVQDCEFQGKYPNMVFHKKSKHADEKLQQILFPQQRQKKKMREALKRLFFGQYSQKLKTYTEQAKLIYVKYKGAVELRNLITMVAHIDNCSHMDCRDIFINEEEVFIGKMDEQVNKQSKCARAMELKCKI